MTQAAAPRIAVLGGGAMGSVFAALFAEAGYAVHLVRRNAEAVAAVNRDGLRLSGFSGDRVVRLPAYGDIHKIGVCAMVVLAVKAYDVAAALAGLGPLLGPHTRVVTMQNGLGSPEQVAAVVGPERTVIGVAENFGASMPGLAHAHHNGMRLVRLGPYAGSADDSLAAIADLWRGAGFPVGVYDDLPRLVWEKLVCNTAFSGPCTLTGRTLGEVVACDDAWSVAAACARETHAVGRAKGIRFSFDDPEAYARAFGQGIPNAHPSLALDRRAGRRTEADALYGRLLAEAHTHGVPVPTLTLIYRLLKAGDPA